MPKPSSLLDRLRPVALWSVAVAALALSACGEEPAGQGSQDAAGAEAGADGESPDVEPKPDVEQPPGKITAAIFASPVAGNAPLPVEFTVTFSGVERDKVFIQWDFGDGSPVVEKNLATPEGASGDRVAHEFPFKGSYQVKVAVIWYKKSSYRGEAVTTIDVKDPVALSLSAIDLVSSPTVGLGADVSLAFSVENTGDAIETEFEIDAYLSATSTFDDTAIKVCTKKIKSMAAGKDAPAVLEYPWDSTAKKGAPYTFQLPTGGLPDGDYFVHVAVDPAKVLNEVNRVDNHGFAQTLLKIDTKVAAKPDLTITPPAFNAALSYSPGDSVPYEHEIANVGDGDAKSIKFAVFLSADQKLDYDFKLPEVCDNPPPPKAKTCGEDPAQVDKMLTKLATSNLLKLGGKTTFPISYAPALPEVPDGDYYLIAKVDVLDAADETNEGNNVAVSTSKLLVKKLVKQGVDLDLIAMTVKPKGTFLGGQIGVEWQVKNSGNQPISTPAAASIYFCPEKAFTKETCVINQKDFALPAFASGETKKGTELVTVSNQTPIKNYYIYLRLDPADKLAELDEGNNVGVFDKLILTATQNVDLAVSAIGFHPEAVVAGGTFKLGYTIKNTGTTGAAAYTTWIALSTAPQCAPGLVSSGANVVIKEVITGGLDGLSEMDVNEVVTVPLGLDHKIDKYHVCVMLDVKGANAKETNKTNNNAASEAQIAVSGAKGGCFEDKLDEAPAHNNSKDSAAAITVGDPAPYGSCGNDDWFKIDVPKGHSLFVTVAATPLFSTTPIPADLDVTLFAPDGATILDAQKLLSAVKKASALTVQQGGVHFIQIQPKPNGSKAQYTLQVQVVPPAAGIDLFAGALTVSPAATYPGALVKTKLKLTNLGDKAAGAFAVRYALSKDGKLDPSDPVLKDLLFGSGVGAAVAQDITHNLILPVVEGGPYYILAAVDVSSAVAETNENNNLSISNTLALNPQQSCLADAYSGNHTVDDAATLPPTGGLVQKLNVCPGLEDWFAISVPTGKALSAKLNWKYQPGKGLVGLQIIDASKTGVLAGAATAVNSVATVPYVQLGGVFYIHTYVLPESGSAVPYDYELNVTVTDPDPTDVCLADAYEPNNSTKSAPEVGCGLATNTLCLGDEDWFKLKLQKDEKIAFDFNHPGNSFLMRLYQNPALPPVKTQPGNGLLQFTAPADGDYFLQIAYKSAGAKPSQGFTYSLKVDGGKGVDLTAKIQSVFPPQVVQGEDVYLTVKVTNECQDPAGDFFYGYYFSADNKLDAGDALISLRPLPGLKGKTAATVDDKAIIPIDAKPGPAYVIVSADATGAVTESQELNNQDAAGVEVIKLCLQDALEPNGAPQIAAPLAMGRTKDLSLCPYELDWYAIDLKKGETLTLTMEFVHDQGDLDMRLYKVAKFAAPVAVAATKKAPEQFTFTADESTKYYVRISGFAGESNAYQLVGCKTMTGKCIECLDDAMCSSSQQCDLQTTLCGPKACTPANLQPCDDANLCTADLCPNGKCKNSLEPGALCDDNEPCSIGESCDKAGMCVAPKVTLVAGLPSGATTAIDVGTDVSLTGDGGYVVVGTREASLGELRGYVARYDKLGQLKWEKFAAEGAAPNLLQAVAVAGGEVVAVGSAGISDKPGVTGAWVVRLSLQDGSIIASKLIQVGSLSAKLEGVAIVSKSDVVVVGSGYDPGAQGGGLDGWIARLDYDGNPLWSNFAGGAGTDNLFDVALTGGAQAVAVGQDDQAGAVKGLFVRVSLSDGGVVKSTSTAKDSANTVFTSVSPLPGGGFAVGGGCDLGQPSAKAYQPLFGRLDAQGSATLLSVIAATTPQAPAFSGTKTGRVEVVRVRPDGSLVAAGWVGSTSEKAFQNDAMVWTIGADDKLGKSWFFGGAGRDTVRGLVPFGEGWLGYGSLAELEAGSDAFRLIILPPSPNCDDFNPCTTDVCAPGAGCGHTPVADGAACASGKVCQAGACK